MERDERRREKGFTLIELVVVLLIIGILATFAVPQYLRTTETNKFDDAVALTNQIGTTNKMFALDHNGVYVNGAFPASGSGTTSCGCGSTTCQNYSINQPTPTPAYPGPFGTPCALVCCNYLSDQNWSAKAYNFWACDGNAGAGSCAGLSGSYVSGAKRNAATAYSPYSTWGVTMSPSGQISPNGTTPPLATY